MRKTLTHLIALTLASASNAATSVSEGEITWTFADDETVGQYADGSWWVVGPVTINSYTGSGGSTSGMMSNPTPEGDQGLDNRVGDYNATLNLGLSLPYTTTTEESLLTAKSYATQTNSRYIERQAVLTVVNSEPSANSFRPTPWGTDKSMSYTTSDLDYNELASESTVTGTPSLATTEGYFETDGLPFMEWDRLWSAKFKMGVDNHDAYGRNIAHKVGEAALQLQLNYSDAQKETLLVKLVQWGIDIWGYYENGGIVVPDGGHKHGRKLCVVLAAEMLDDADILDIANDLLAFQEDQTTFQVAAGDVGRTVNSGNTYSSDDIGVYEWGIRHSTNPEQDNSAWGAPYRTVVGPSLVGHALACHMMGITATWNNGDFFGYIDRLYEIEEPNHSTGFSNYITTFTRNMWEAYRGLTPPTGQVEPAILSPETGYHFLDQVVTISTATAGADIYYTTDGSTPDSGSTLYSGSLTLNQDTRIRTIAVKMGETDSELRDESYYFTDWPSVGETWSNVTFSDEAHDYIKFYIQPLASEVDGVAGVSSGSASAYTDLGLIVRCALSGEIEFRNGGSYSTDVTTTYSSGTKYIIEFVDIDWSGKTYDGIVDGVLVADDYSFRTEQASLSTVDNIGFIDSTSSGFRIGELSFDSSGAAYTGQVRLSGSGARPSLGGGARFKLD